MQGGFFMEKFQVYRDIQARTGGDIYIGVVGPVRTGKSTFIRRFMELVALPEMEPAKQAEVRDQLPLSGSGKLITTVEPKFIPKEAVEVPLGDEQKVRIRLIDCVGFLVKDASGHIEEGKERMVKTPWFEKAIPFHEAAEIGTRKVIEEHATIGLVITTDGSFGELPRENFAEAEAATINQLKKQRKPFLLLVNSQAPYKEETQDLVRSLQEKYGVITMAANCEQLRKEDVTKILSNVLYEFPVTEIQFFVPKWVEMLPADHELKARILDCIRTKMKGFHHIKGRTIGGTGVAEIAIVVHVLRLDGRIVAECVIEGQAFQTVCSAFAVDKVEDLLGVAGRGCTAGAWGAGRFRRVRRIGVAGGVRRVRNVRRIRFVGRLRRTRRTRQALAPRWHADLADTRVQAEFVRRCTARGACGLRGEDQRGRKCQR